MILIVDAMAIIREPIAASLQRAGFETACAPDAERAMGLMRSRCPDLLLLDASLPGKSGLDLVAEMRAQPTLARVPVILLTSLSDKETILRARKLGIVDYLLKRSFSLTQLIARIKQRVGADTAQAVVPTTAAPATARGTAPAALSAGLAGDVQKLLTRDECIRRTQTALESKTLSGVVAQVISLAASPRSDMSQMASLIGRDAMLATRVLQAANSAVYRSSGGPISTIPDAVRRIGCSAVRGIASALGVFDAMPATSADGFNPIRSWQHSLAVATLCERFTAVTDPDNAGIAYLVGLCHDLGDILFQTQFAAEYRQVLDAEKRTQRRRADLERDMLGMTHGELVVTILRAINLPDGIRTPIEAFHASPAAAARNPLSRVLCVADQLANGMLLASSVDSEIRPLSRAECHAATGNEAPELPDTIAFRTEISVMTSMLARLSAADERKMMEPMFKLRDRTLWLARDSSLSPSDPVALALATMVNIQVHDRLPGAGEAQSLQGLFVLARDATVPGFSAAEVTKSQRLLDASAFVLCLTGAADKTAPLAAEQDHKRYPIKLEELASFVAKACDLVGTRASENRAA